MSRPTLLQWGRNFAVAETYDAYSMLYDLNNASMGPQLCSCGNCMNGMRSASVYVASMGPQLCSCGNRVKERQPEYSVCRLQWGRNFAVAETYWLLGEDQAAVLASMGPQLCSCGNRRGQHFVCGGGGASMGPQLCSCGNAFVGPGFCYVGEASMGPQLCSCGNGTADWRTLPSTRCFNGAATLQLRKQRLAMTLKVLCTCFNGAATLQLRKLLVGKMDGIRPFLLQWGRNFAVAETEPDTPRSNANAPASMGPQLCSCGNLERQACRLKQH